MTAAEPEKDRSSTQLSAIKWHIERYDRLRTSATSRAAVVLSAAALLSAGNAIFLTQLLSSTAGWLHSWRLIVLTVLALASVGLVIGALLRAANVLMTARGSREIFAGAHDAPPAPIYNGSDTVSQFSTFDEFQAAILGQDGREAVQAASVELWINIIQHRHRYGQLRQAVIVLRYAAISFLVVLTVAIVLNTVYRA